MMVDFQRLQETFLTDVYHEERLQFGTVRKDRDFEPLSRLTRTRCWEKCYRVSQRLEQRKMAALQVLDDIIAQKKELHDQEEAFQQYFLQFNEQVVLNAAKRERALMRFREHRDFVNMRSTEIEILLKEVVKLRDYRTKFTEEIKKHLLYEEFLSTALYDFGSRAKVFDMITRYCSLVSKRKYLNSRNLKMHETLKTNYQKSLVIVATYNEIVMNMRNQISKDMVKYEQAVKRSTELEYLHVNLWENCSSRMEDMILSIQGIHNLNDMINSKSIFPEISWMQIVEEEERLPDVIQNIVNIKSRMGQMYMVIKKVKDHLKVLKTLWGKKGYTVLDKKQKK